MKDARVMHQRRVERIGQGEAAEAMALEVMDGGCAALDVLAPDQQYQHIIDAVAMQAFGRWFPDLAGAGFDAKLMHLDVPGGDSGIEALEELAAKAQDCAGTRLATWGVLLPRMETIILALRW